MKLTTRYLDRKFREGHKPRHCWICRCLLTRGTATVDHLIPKSHGGRDRAENFALACQPCNLKRGNSYVPKAVRLALKGKTPSPVKPFVVPASTSGGSRTSTGPKTTSASAGKDSSPTSAKPAADGT